MLAKKHLLVYNYYLFLYITRVAKMLETCKSCGTVFEIDEKVISQNIQWLKCGVCNEKWNVSEILRKDLEEEGLDLKKQNSKNLSEKVKHDLASIKSAVENKTKKMSSPTNPVLDQKNKTVLEIASELSTSKLKSDDHSDTKRSKKYNEKRDMPKNRFFLFVIISFVIILFITLFFRSMFLSYTYLYFPKYADFYADKLNEISLKLKLPILAELNYINLNNFVATSQNEEIKFSGSLTNTSQRPVLVPRIKILAVREDRKIILEEILVLEQKIIKPKSKIEFQNTAKLKINTENISVKATLLKEIFDY